MKRWTTEEVKFLSENWGKLSVPVLAKNLGRTEIAILIKRDRLGLGAFLAADEFISLYKLCKCLKISYNGETKNVFAKRGLNIKCKKVHKNRFLLVSVDDFWKFAEQNKEFIDFSRIEPLIFGKEPEWVAEARKADFLYKHKKTKWTAADISRLKLYLEKGYTYRQISIELNRTEHAVKKRINKLNLKIRPDRTSIKKWTAAEYAAALNLSDKGYSFEAIADELGRTALSVRSKFERENKRNFEGQDDG